MKFDSIINLKYRSQVFLAVLVLVVGSGLARADQQANKEPLVIEEFADFECSYCAKGNSTMKEVQDFYKQRVKIVFRNFPLDFHNNAYLAAKANIAISMQNSEFAALWREQIFLNQQRLSSEGGAYIFEVANQLGVNIDRMRSDMNSTKVIQLVESDKQRAQELGFKGTPSFLIGTVKLSGARSLEEFKKIIDEQLSQPPNP
jgi:predicted DsbA family dithiol-disulfide isomerase